MMCLCISHCTESMVCYRLSKQSDVYLKMLFGAEKADMWSSQQYGVASGLQSSLHTVTMACCPILNVLVSVYRCFSRYGDHCPYFFYSRLLPRKLDDQQTQGTPAKCNRNTACLQLQEKEQPRNLHYSRHSTTSSCLTDHQQTSRHCKVNSMWTPDHHNRACERGKRCDTPASRAESRARLTNITEW